MLPRTSAPTAPSLPAIASSRNLALDGLRGYAALAVVIYHAILFPIGSRCGELLAAPFWALHGYDRYARVVLALVSGETAVIIFFIMSGAILMHALERESTRKGMAAALCAFPLRRALRIYPALLCCLAGLALIYGACHLLFPQLYPVPQWTAILKNAALYETSAQGATWTLKAEILAIPFIIAAFVLRRCARYAGLGLVFAYALAIAHKPALSPPVWLLSYWLPYFAAGFLAYDISRLKSAQALLSGRRWLVVLALAVLLRVCFPGASEFARLTQLAAVAILVAGILSGADNGLTRFLALPVSVFLGRISYSLYLWNVIFLNVLLIPAARIDWATTHYVESGLIIGVSAALLSIPFSVWSERYCERPFMRLGRGSKSVQGPGPAIAPPVGPAHASLP